MDQSTLTALLGSIAKWQAIVDGTGQDHGSHNCPLCQKFLFSMEYDTCSKSNHPCRGCPVHKASGDGCNNTPYPGRDCTKEEAQAELAFLQGLLPEPPTPTTQKDPSHA